MSFTVDTNILRQKSCLWPICPSDHHKVQAKHGTALEWFHGLDVFKQGCWPLSCCLLASVIGRHAMRSGRDVKSYLRATAITRSTYLHMQFCLCDFRGLERALGKWESHSQPVKTEVHQDSWKTRGCNASHLARLKKHSKKVWNILKFKNSNWNVCQMSCFQRHLHLISCFTGTPALP